MKKNVLFLGLLGLALNAQAQSGPWVPVNTVNSQAFAPGYRITDVKTISPTVAWLVAQESSTAGYPNSFFVTNNPAGDQFSFGTTIPGNGAQNFQTGNISGVTATAAVAATYPQAGGGGELIRTTNGGVSWNKVSTASQFNGNIGGFCDFVHMFSATEGVALGDPTNGSFEILRTTDSGATWTRVPAANMPTPLANEYGLTRSFFAQGNTIWAGMGSSVSSDPVRVLRSTDKGVTWTASPVTTLLGGINRLAFKDANNGIAYSVTVANGAVTAVNLIRTADGGATWSAITPVNTNSGSFFRYDIDAIDGRYYSIGQRFPVTSPAATAYDFGASYSTDGINWTNTNRSQGYFAFDLVTGATTGAAAGYAGTQTDANGVGGIFKAINANIIAATRDGALESALTVFPNPSATGIFNVDLGSNLKAGAKLTVMDALGRQVKSQTLTAATVGARTFALDLSTEKAGVYMLQIQTEAGLATRKLVVE